MIRRALLIGRQEFVKYVTRRGFLISLLMFPMILVLAVSVPRLMASHPRANVMTVVDQAGGYARAFAEGAAREQAKAELSALAKYARQNADMQAVAHTNPALAKTLAEPERLAHVKAFAARGGWRAAFAILSPHLRAGAPVFTAPTPMVEVVPPPSALSSDLAERGSTAAQAYLTGAASVTADGHPARLSSIVVIPKGFGPDSDAAAQYWTADSEQSLDFVQTVLNEAVRLRAVENLLPAGTHAELDVDVGVQVIDPTRAARVSFAARLAQLVPMGLAFVLFIVAFSDAALLLQSVVEEKSTRMIEVLLSCASPQEIMTGKLIGVLGLAMVTLVAWGVVLFAFASFLSPGTVGAVISGLKTLVPMLPLVLLYFFCGLMIYASIFLGIGATTASLPDAQALIGPATMIIVLPNLLMGAVIQDPNGMLARIISWIPIYTPFFMLVRLPFHPAPLELWLTAGLTVATTVFLIRQMGRVFARHVLTTERPPSFGKLVRHVFGRGKAT